MRQLGLSLSEIRVWLDRPDRTLADDLELHLARLGREIETLERLRGRLGSIARHLRATGTISVDALLECMEIMMNVEKHFTPEQLETIERRGRELGPEAIARTQTDWTELIAEVQAAMDRGADPASAEVRALARRWQELVARFTGGDAGIAQGVAQVWRQEGEQVRQQFGGPSPAMFEYVRRAHAAES